MVEFEDGGQTYSYLADTDDYEVDDLVVVPAGYDNRETVVRIVSIEYRQPEDAPFPLEKTKHILRKYEKEKLNYQSDYYCPVYDKEIDPDLCCGTIGVLNRTMPPDEVPELLPVMNLDPLLEKCDKCPYHEQG